MKRKIMMALFAAVLCAGSSMTAFAMPEQMPDGGVFDAEYYAEENPDVVAVMGSEKDALYLHYTLAGKSEGRLPGVFDAEYYAANNPDVAAVVGTDGEKLYQHYMLCGKSEGRIPGVPGTALKPIKASAPAAAESETPAQDSQQQNKGIQGVLGETYTLRSVVSKKDSETGSIIYRESAVNVRIQKGSLDDLGYWFTMYKDVGEENHRDGWYFADISWLWDVERSKNWRDDEYGKWDSVFTVTQDGEDYPYCKVQRLDSWPHCHSFDDDEYNDCYDTDDGYACARSDFCVYVPRNYNGEFRLTVYANKLDENGEPVKDEQNFITYVSPIGE